MIFQIIWTIAFTINLGLSIYLLYQSSQDVKVVNDEKLRLLAEWTYRAELVRCLVTVVFLLVGLSSFFSPDLLGTIFAPALTAGGVGILLNTTFTYIYRHRIYVESERIK